MANVSKINFNGEALDIKDTHAREQILHLTADNYTADVTGDYTVNAGDIAMSSANATMHTTADRTIDTDGNDSVHIDGASTLNVGGLRTETFAGDKTETVTGTSTEKFANISTTVTGKWMVKTPSKSFSMAEVATDGDISAINTSITNINGEISDINNTIASLSKQGLKSVKSFGAVGDGVHDDTQAFKNAVAGGGLVFVPDGNYKLTSTVQIPSNTRLFGCNASKIIGTGTAEYIFQITGTATAPAKFITIENLEITDNNDTAHHHFAIWISQTEKATSIYTDNIVIRNVYIHDMSSRGISTHAGGIGSLRNHVYGKIYIDNCRFDNCGGSVINSSVSVSITNCTFTANKATGGETVSIDNGCILSRIAGCYFSNNSGGAGVISIDECDGLIIDGCEFADNNLNDIRFNLESGNDNNVTIVNSVFFGSGNSAITTATNTSYVASRLNIIGNIFNKPTLFSQTANCNAFLGNVFGGTDKDAMNIYSRFFRTDLAFDIPNSEIIANYCGDVDIHLYVIGGQLRGYIGTSELTAGKSSLDLPITVQFAQHAAVSAGGGKIKLRIDGNRITFTDLGGATSGNIIMTL